VAILLFEPSNHLKGDMNMNDKAIKELVKQIEKMQNDVMKISGYLGEMSAWIKTHLEIKDRDDKAVVFLNHMENEMNKMGLNEDQVMCKICNKLIGEIYNEEKFK
jgi:hypothetical protein